MMGDFLIDHAHHHGWFQQVEHVMMKAYDASNNTRAPPNQKVEMELRFGQLGDALQSRPNYRGGISSNAHDRLINRHQCAYSSFKVESQHYIVPCSEADDRSLHIDLDRKTAIEKESLAKCTNTEWGLRFQASVEKTLSSSEYANIVSNLELRNCYRRHRKRQSFWLVKNEWRLDVTEVETLEPNALSGKTSWEAEVEYTGCTDDIESETFIHSYLRIVASLQQIVQDSFYPITSTKSIELDGILGQARQRHPFLGMVQPRTLNRNDLSTSTFDGVKMYGLTCKADGERGLLLFDKNKCAFLYTAVDRWRQLPSFNTDKWANDYSYSIFDGEYDGHRFYAFDIVSMSGKPVTKELDLSLQKRVELLRGIREQSCNLFEVKEYVFVSTLDELTKEAGRMLEHAETMGPYSIDGLIITPNNETPDFKTKTWRIQMKWKMQPTIDALFASDPDEKRVYVSGRNNDTIVFMPVESNLYPGRIAEFAWKKSSLVFQRLRPDKTVPNFLDVATDIVKSYKEPVSFTMMTGKDIILPSVPRVPTISKRSRETDPIKSKSQKRTKT